MKYIETQPGIRLRRHVKCFWTLLGDAEDYDPEGIAPDGSVEMIFNLAAPFRRHYRPGRAELQPASMIVGQMRQPVVVQPTGRVEILGVRFHPHGFHGFIRQALDEFTDKLIDCRDVWGRSIGQLEEGMLEAKLSKRIAIIETFLLGLIEHQGTPTKTYEGVGVAVKLVQSTRGLQPIEKIAQTVGMSPRHLERQFKSIVGLSPKTLERIVRFQHALQLLRNGGAQGAGIAIECGYYDQAHFIRDFKSFTGRPPSAYSAETYHLAPHFIQEAAVSDFYNT